ncbi:c-type cytochrome [Terricaulis sp.]|uniref:c-type cytochrome n=1 Tax=Terricaulis sp. TaxID=2768686 RepID=UPI003784A4A9
MRFIVPAFALLLLAACGDGGGSSTSSTASTAPTTTATTASSDDHAEQQERVAALPAPYNEANYASGMEHFRECRACHTIEPNGGNRAGPNLHGIFGRAVASTPNFNYSAALRGSGLTWDAATLDRWITKPGDVVPNTYMAFRGFNDERVRRDVIAYMMIESGAAPDSESED